jgi:hypothetical protein
MTNGARARLAEGNSRRTLATRTIGELGAAHASADAKGGYPMHWTTPRIVEIKMDAEIGSYQEDGDDGTAPKARHRERQQRSLRREPGRVLPSSLACRTPA